MTPEEIEAFRGWCRIYEMPENSWTVMALEHIDQQAASLAEAEVLIRKNVELMNGYLARITELESQILHQTAISACRIEGRERLQKQIATLQEIAISERERRHIADMSRFGFVLDSDASPDPRKLARDQLAKEHPEAFR